MQYSIDTYTIIFTVPSACRRKEKYLYPSHFFFLTGMLQNQPHTLPECHSDPHPCHLICCSAFCFFPSLPLCLLLPPWSAARHTQRLPMSLVACMLQIGHPFTMLLIYCLNMQPYDTFIPSNLTDTPLIIYSFDRNQQQKCLFYKSSRHNCTAKVEF